MGYIISAFPIEMGNLGRGGAYACQSSTSRFVRTTFASGYALISSAAKHAAGISVTA